MKYLTQKIVNSLIYKIKEFLVESQFWEPTDLYYILRKLCTKTSGTLDHIKSEGGEGEEIKIIRNSSKFYTKISFKDNEIIVTDDMIAIIAQILKDENINVSSPDEIF